MSHVLHVTCHKCYMLQILSCQEFTKDPMCYIFLESSCKIQFNGDTKNITCVTCHMSQILHVTNIKLPRILAKTTCVIYFWKALAKSSSMVIQKTSHVACHKCYMSPILSCQEFYQRPHVLYIFGKLL